MFVEHPLQQMGKHHYNQLLGKLKKKASRKIEEKQVEDFKQCDRILHSVVAFSKILPRKELSRGLP